MTHSRVVANALQKVLDNGTLLSQKNQPSNAHTKVSQQPVGGRGKFKMYRCSKHFTLSVL